MRVAFGIRTLDFLLAWDILAKTHRKKEIRTEPTFQI
jgi:hypothetical protein